MKKIVCAHLFNDYSGSPLVLSTAIKGFLKNGLEVDVITSAANEGFLSKLKVNYRDNNYKLKSNLSYSRDFCKTCFFKKLP